MATGHTKIRAEEFIDVWQTSSSHKEVAERLGIDPGYAATKASKFRNKGVPLKYYKREGAGLDWDELAKRAARLLDIEE